MSRVLAIPEDWPTDTVKMDLIGAGGTGSQVADQLASMEATLRSLGHPGFQVTVHDGDLVSQSNIGRQRFTSHDIGIHKAIVLCHRINAFYGLDWKPSPAMVNPRHRRLQADRDGLVITCVDKARFRAELGKTYRKVKTNALWLDLGNGDRSAQCILGHLGLPTQGDRVPNVLDLYPELISMDAVDEEAPSCSAEQAIARQPWPINRLVAITATEMLWNLFRAGHLTEHGQFLSINPLRTNGLPVDPIHWQMLGYKAPGRKRAKSQPVRAAA